MDSNFLEQLAQLELRYKKFSLVGTGEVRASGSLKTGFAVNVEKAGADLTSIGPANGGCCVGTDCSITTFADCAGTWRGPGTICTPNPCATPCCPSPTLVCDSISASLSKCGYSEFCDTSSPPKFYLSYSLSRSGSNDKEVSSDCPVPGAAFTLSETSDVAQSITRHYDISDPSLCNEVTDTDTASSHHLHVLNGSTISTCSSSTDTSCWEVLNCGSGDCGSDNTTCAPTSKVHTIVYCSAFTNEFYCNVEHTHPSICSETGSDVTTETLSDEYTTADLVSNTEAALPDYSDCFGCDAESCSYPEGEDCTCTASRDLADDESSYSIRRFKYKFTWATPLTVDCKISWIERTYDSDGNPVSDTPMSETVSAGETESTVYEVMEPTDNGTIGVVFPIGPCCTAGVCSTTDEATCEGGGGTYGGDGCIEDGCTPDPC